MTVGQRNTDCTREKYIHRLFDSIATRYDLMNLVLTGGLVRYWQRVFRGYTGLRPGDRALDVCCGTAELALIMARQVGKAGQVYGLDFSRRMLEVARRKVASSPYAGRIELLEGNALHLPFADNTFNCAAIGFALRNVSDIQRVLAEMARVVTPGGRVISLELTKPGNPLFRMGYYLYFYHLVPLLGRLVERGWPEEEGKRPYTWLPHSLTRFPDRHRLAGIFRQAGLVDVVVRPMSGGTVAIHAGTKPRG